MQSAQLDNNEVIIEYVTDVQENKVMKLKTIFIKSKPDRELTQHVDSDDGLPAVLEPDREHTQHVDGDDGLPAVPYDNFTHERERMIDS